jgi:hypothetical protein
MTLADDPHLVERIARLAAFHDLPVPVVVQLTLMVSELHRRPAGAVHDEIERRIYEIRTTPDAPKPRFRVV